MKAIPMSPTEDSISFESSSFRDRDSRVFRHQGGIYRTLSARAQKDWEQLRDSRVFERWQSSGELIGTTECSPPVPLKEPWTQVLSHQRIPFVSYPHEWCFWHAQGCCLAAVTTQSGCSQG